LSGFRIEWLRTDCYSEAVCSVSGRSLKGQCPAIKFLGEHVSYICNYTITSQLVSTILANQLNY